VWINLAFKSKIYTIYTQILPMSTKHRFCFKTLFENLIACTQGLVCFGILEYSDSHILYWICTRSNFVLSGLLWCDSVHKGETNSHKDGFLVLLHNWCGGFPLPCFLDSRHTDYLVSHVAATLGHNHGYSCSRSGLNSLI
jgi:hypothetical protein